MEFNLEFGMLAVFDVTVPLETSGCTPRHKFHHHLYCSVGDFGSYSKTQVSSPSLFTLSPLPTVNTFNNISVPKKQNGVSSILSYLRKYIIVLRISSSFRSR
jgi:hypothetical protein